MGLPKIQMGKKGTCWSAAGRLASLLRVMSASEAPKVEPRPLLRVQVMMVAPENDGGPLQNPESSPLESQSFVRSRKTTFFRPDLLRGASIYNYTIRKTTKRNTICYSANIFAEIQPGHRLASFKF
jgi:hypothetical protein